MKNITNVFFIFILIINCDTKEEKISTDYFKNKTFTFYANDSIPPFKLNFDDSTCFTIEEKPTNFNWKLNYYNNSNFLIIDNTAYGMKVNLKENYIELINIPNNNFNFKIFLNEPKYEKDKLIGEWIYDQVDSINFLKSSIPPPLPPFAYLQNFKKTWPPKLILTKDSIFYEYLNFRSKSGYKFDNSNQFIFLNLKTESFFENHIFWELEKVNDSILNFNSNFINEINSNKIKKSFKLKKINYNI